MVRFAAGPFVFTRRVPPFRVTVVLPKGVPAVAWVIKVAPPEMVVLELVLLALPFTAPPLKIVVPPPVTVSAPPPLVVPLTMNVLPATTLIEPAPDTVSTRLVVRSLFTSSWPPLKVMPPGATTAPFTVMAFGLPRLLSAVMLTTPALRLIWALLFVIEGPKVLVPLSTSVPRPILVRLPTPAITLEADCVRSWLAPTSNVPPVPTPATPTRGGARSRLKFRFVV